MFQKVKKLVFLLCFLVTGFKLYSESVFSLNLKEDIIISTLALTVFSTPFFIHEERIIPDNLNINDVNAFDRRLMFPHNETFENISEIIVRGIIIAPIITVLAGEMRKNFDTWMTYGVMYLQVLALTHGTSNIIKRTVERYRPYLYFGDIRSDIFQRSFPSGTTAHSFAAATFFSVTFSSEYPDSVWRFPVIIGSYSLVSLVGVSRILSGNHFLSDVLVGAAIGSFFGWIIPALHKRNNNENNFSFNFTGNGAIVSFSY